MTLTLTPSNSTWLSQCAKRFDTLAVRKQYPSIKSTKSSVLAFSNACHHALRHLYDPLVPGPLPHAENLTTYIKMAFLRESFYRDQADREHDMMRAHRLISRYLSDDLDGNATTAVELSGNFPIEISGEVAFRVSARLDRVLIRADDPTTIVVRDYKLASSLRSLEPIQVYINLAVLKLAHLGQFRHHALELCNLTDDGFETTTYHSADLKGIHKHVAALVERYETADDYPPTPSDYCQFCPLLDECQSVPPASLDAIAFDD